MKIGDVALTPQVCFLDTQANIEAFVSPQDGMEGITTDLIDGHYLKGIYMDGAWRWRSVDLSGGLIDAPTNGIIYGRIDGEWVNPKFRDIFESAVEGEVIVNGGFGADTDWTKGPGWTIGGTAIATGVTTGTLTQTVDPLNPLDEYLIYFEVVVTSGDIEFFDSDGGGININASGSYFERFTSFDGSFGFRSPSSSFTGTIDNVSAIRIVSMTLAQVQDLTDGGATNLHTHANASTSAAGLAPTATAPAAGLLNVLSIINGATAYSLNDFATWVRSALLTGLSTATNAVIAATDTVLVALGKLQAQINDGWIGVSWAGLTRVSATVFTTTTDVSGIVGKKTKLKFTDTTTKYLPVLSATWNGSVTTITTIANNDYALVGNPSAVYYSNIENPFGWPDTFAFTISPTNLTVVGTPTYTGKFRADGFVTITLVATTSIASTGGSTYVNSPFNIMASSILASGFYNTAPGNSFAYDADDNIYLPTFAANGNMFAISGFISY